MRSLTDGVCTKLLTRVRNWRRAPPRLNVLLAPPACSTSRHPPRPPAHRLALDGETLRKPQEKSAKRGKLDTDNAE
jgi:hypothetical protein